MDKWLIDSEIFLHPFTCIISGPTMCGKTFLLKEILINRHVLIKPSPDRIIFCYKAWQKSYEDFKNSIPGIEFNDGIIDMDSLNQNVNNLVIFDDLMSECIKSESVLNLFTVGSHHKNTGVFFITQNIWKSFNNININKQRDDNNEQNSFKLEALRTIRVFDETANSLTNRMNFRCKKMFIDKNLSGKFLTLLKFFEMEFSSCSVLLLSVYVVHSSNKTMKN